MGSPLRLVAPLPQLERAWPRVLEVFADAERTLTRFDPASPLSRLNQAAGGAPQPVPRLLATALAAAHRAYRLTGGLFDPRIIGALERAGEHAGVALPASPAGLRPDEPWLTVNRGPLRAAVDAPVDLGGIGKGLALRWAARELHRSGVRSFLLDAGGDLVARGAPLGGTPWRVAVAHPAGRDPAAVVELGDGALATSSVEFRRWTAPDGTPAHHIIDPRTGRPATSQLVSVTVAAPDPAWAEILAKAILIGDREPEAWAAWCTSRDGDVAITTVAEASTVWRRGRRVAQPSTILNPSLL